ncbi:MAG: transcription antitermination factor NusB [Planctomycetota bacterium]
MRKRTLSREFALKALYVYDVREGLSDEKLEALAESEALSEVPEFGRRLIEGVMENGEEVDAVVQETAENWRMERMPTVDRNILRLATYELLYQVDTPPKVAINEAIELAKKFSTENSPMFVNGVLDKIYSNYADEREAQEPEEMVDVEQMRRFPPLPCADIQPDPMERVDLHMHSHHSDGSLSPVELAEKADRKDLAAIAISDHDTVQGVAEARERCEDLDVMLVPAVELTAYSRGDTGKKEHELHLLGYFIDETDSYLLDKLEAFKRTRVQRVKEMASRLQDLGVDFDAEKVLDQVRDGAVGRVHVAQELVNIGEVSTVKEAFDKYLAQGKPAYVPKERLTPAQAIRLIHDAGGAAVLAHPGVNDSLREMLDELEEGGLDGIEVHYPSHSAEQEAWWLDAARKLDLVVTGGSDFHGDPKPHIHLAQETVSLVQVANLRARARKYREHPAAITAAADNVNV